MKLKPELDFLIRFYFGWLLRLWTSKLPSAKNIYYQWKVMKSIQSFKFYRHSFPLSSPFGATSSLLDTDVVHVAYLGPEKSHYSLSRLSLLAARGIFASKFLPTLFRLHNGRRRFGGGGMFYTRRLAQLLGFEEAISGECMCCRGRQADWLAGWKYRRSEWVRESEGVCNTR